MSETKFSYEFATEYTKYPGGRYRRHGPYSGEAFREDVLAPLLEKHQNIHIDLSNTMGFGSSFLDEAFGEMGKRLGEHQLKSRVIFSSEDDPALVPLIWAKVSKAAKE